MQNPTPAQLASGVDGNTVLWLNEGSNCSQDVGPAAAQTNYSLAVNVGSQTGFSGAYTISYAGCSTSGTTQQGSLTPVTLPCPTPSGELVVTVTSTSGQVIFDKVVLTATPVVPIPPQQSINFTFAGVLQWSDGTPIAGSVLVEEWNIVNGSVWNTLGTMTPDSAGNVGGTTAFSTNFADMPTIRFSLMDASGNSLGSIAQTVPGAMFGSQSGGVITQAIHGISGFKIVVTKGSCPQCTLAAGSSMGAIN